MNIYYEPAYLQHHGVKGMKWGRRRYQNKDGSLTPAGKKRYDSAGDVKTTKSAYKKAAREYSRSYDKAYNRNLAAISPIKKHREANDKRWEDAYDKANAMNDAKSAYKDAKFKKKVDSDNRKRAIKQTTKELNKQASFAEKLTYNNATRKQAAKYVVDKNMTVEEATKKAQGDARRNTAIFVAAYAGVTLASTYLNR